MDKKTKLKQAILSGQVKDKATALQFVLKEKEKEELKKEILSEIPNPIKGEQGVKGDRGADGKDGEPGKDGKPGRDGRDGQTPEIPIDQIVATSVRRATQAIEKQIPSVDTIIKELPARGEVFRDGLELLQGEERLDASAIKNLPKLVKEYGFDGTGSPAGALRIDGANAPITDISWGGYKITNLKDPTSDQDAATKKYVNDAVSVENLWDRTGTTLTPHTAGDNAQVSIVNGLLNFDGYLGYLTAGGYFQLYDNSKPAFYQAQLAYSDLFGVNASAYFVSPAGSLYLGDDLYIINAIGTETHTGAVEIMNGAHTAIFANNTEFFPLPSAGYFTDSATVPNEVYICDDNYAINAIGASTFTDGDYQANLTNDDVGFAGQFINTATGTEADLGVSTYAGYFTDGAANSVFLADFTYAVNAFGKSFFDDGVRKVYLTDNTYAINAVGNILQNNNATVYTPPTGTTLHINAPNSTLSKISHDTYASSGWVSFRRTNGTNASPSGIVLNNQIGGIQGYGRDSTGYSTSSGGQIDFVAGGTWTSTSHPTYIRFSTARTDSTTIAERMRINANGDIQIANTAYIVDGSGVPTIDIAMRYLMYSSGALSVDWDSGALWDADGYLSYDFLQRIMYASDGTTAALNYGAPGEFFFGTPTNTDAKMEFGGTSNNGVFYWMEDEDYFEFKDTIVGDADLFFIGDGSGLPYGEMYANNVTQTVTVSATDTYYEVDGNLTGGELNLCTFPDDHYVLVQKAGRYLINWSMSVYCASANQEVEGAVMIGGTVQTKGTAHGNMITANSPITISGTLIKDCSANDQISLGLANHTSTTNIVMQHASLTVTMVGGT